VLAPLAGYVFDVTGSYHMAFIGAIVMLAGAACLLLLLPPAEQGEAGTQVAAASP
jgi:hypothetical protein